MTVTRVLHQQFMQLRWHLLACVGFIMVLPIQEAIINLRDKDGHFESGLSGISLALAPLLAALLACANVQADMDERRDLFWRAKPVRIGAFVSLKYLTGILLTVVLIACPVLFVLGITRILGESVISTRVYHYLLTIFLLSLLCYTLCFFANVLIRKTARAWLIGITLAGFILFSPMLLSLQFKDISVDIENTLSRTYTILTLSISLIGVVLIYLACRYNWHIQTNLKGLLWAGTGLAFGITLLLTRQVANIPVLDETARELKLNARTTPYRFQDQILIPGQKAIKAESGKLMLAPLPEDLAADAHRLSFRYHRLHDGDSRSKICIYPRPGWDEYGCLHHYKNQTYTLGLFAHYRQERDTSDQGRKITFVEDFSLHSFKAQQPVGALDLAGTLDSTRHRRYALRAFDDRLLLAVNNELMDIQLTEDGSLQLVDHKRIQILARPKRTGPFTVPLIPVEHLPIHDRIRMSIDLVFWPVMRDLFNGTSFQQNSLVDINGDSIRFATIDRYRITCYEVIDWDQKVIRCQQLYERRLNWLEASIRHFSHFVENGKLYTYTDKMVMVFDLRSPHGIRKLGHFQRLHQNFNIQSIRIDGQDNLFVFSVRHESERIGDEWKHHRYYTVHLLKDPKS